MCIESFAYCKLVGSYPAVVKAGGGYVWGVVLEYRVWCSPRDGAEDTENGNDYYYAFETCVGVLVFFEIIKGGARTSRSGYSGRI